MKNSPDQKLESVVSSMVEVYEMLKATGIRDHTGQNLEFLYWNKDMKDDQRRARRAMDKALNTIISTNPHVSKRLVYDKLLFRIIRQAVYYIGEKHDIRSEVEHATNELLDYHPPREIDIPIINLEIGPEPIKFGLVTFYSMTDEDKEESWLANIAKKGTIDEIGAISYARVVASGDLEKSREDADKIVNDALTYLRAVGLSISPETQIGVINDFPTSQIRPYRSGPAPKNPRLEADISYSWRLGPGHVPYDLRKDILSRVNSSTLEKLQDLTENDYRKSRTNMRRKFLLGLHWLGDATKPDAPEAKFAKLAFALEALIGGEAKEDNLSTRGLTATLAEPGAFIAGEDEGQRKEIHDAIYTYYGYRSGIVHGGGKQICDDQLASFALLIRRIAWSLLDKIDILTDVDSLQKWVLSQRYA